MTKKVCFLFILLALLLGQGCHRSSEPLEPKIDYAIQDRYLLSLPSPFASLTQKEEQEDWSKEYKIAISFAHELDLYQAITAFKRAEFLLPSTEKERKLEIEYEILLCYYLGKKYADVIHVFETTDLHFVNPSFPACHDLLLILYESYKVLGQEQKAQSIHEYMAKNYPESAEKLYVSSRLIDGDLQAIEKISEFPSYSYLQSFLKQYETEKKSIGKAQLFNALLPGAGFFYLGQKQTALTALLVNGLFIAASYYFFDHGNIPAGIIFTSFEAGWYFGGIHGAKEEAKLYNERVYEKYATPLMNKQSLFPGLMIQYAF